MTSYLLRAVGSSRICRVIAVAALVLTPSFSSRVFNSALAFAAQSGDPSPAATKTPPPSPAKSTQPAAAKTPPPAKAEPPSPIKSKIGLVVDARTSDDLFAKNADMVVPIASITKLMTAMVVLDAKQPMDEILKISNEDKDFLMGTSSHLLVGYSLSREDMLHLALMASENRAAAALSRYYEGGRPGFIAAMNAKAQELGMTRTHFVNPNGLTNENVSTAHDLAKLVRAADKYPLIRQFTTEAKYTVKIGRYPLTFYNPDRLVGRPDWDIEVQKTGFTNAAGRCLAIWVDTKDRSLIMIFLDGYGKLTRYADARRVLLELAQADKKQATEVSR